MGEKWDRLKLKARQQYNQRKLEYEENKKIEKSAYRAEKKKQLAKRGAMKARHEFNKQPQGLPQSSFAMGVWGAEQPRKKKKGNDDWLGGMF